MGNLKTLQHDWDCFAQKDPLWAVISWPEKRGGKWDLSEFFETGRQQVAEDLQRIRDANLTLRIGTALDFGCGVGRLSQALAEKGFQVVGVDIAPSMIEFGKRHNRFGDQVQYILNETSNLSQFGDGEFDLVYSSITLQHVPRETIPGYLREFGRVLKKGGVLFFQLPARNALTFKGILWRILPAKAVTALLRWKNRLPVSMQMNALPQKTVLQILDDANLDVVAVLPNNDAGSDWVSNQYIARRVS